ncbi:MgtC/SapB family protein [Candidatus Peregrinibacteria bacterium]|nr:MAG: MgtC/SapB family protein [Candidatus Peregrinibacteria bacterium]
MTENFATILISFLTAAGLSGLIGLEREIRLQSKDDPFDKQLGGLRTYSMMGALGFLGFFLSEITESLIPLILLFVSAISFSLSTHIFVGFFQKRFGLTSEFSLLASFCVGILVAMEQTLLAISVSILFTGLLTMKTGLHRLAKNMKTEEILLILKFLIISAVVLPLLPAHWTDPFGFFDWRPQTVWLMVVLVVAIRFIGYFLSKFFRNDSSLLLSGIVGGFISSTAVTVGVAQESKGKKEVNMFLLPILLASSLMFFRVIFEISIVAQEKSALLLHVAPPLASMGLFLLGVVVFFFFRRKRVDVSQNAPVEVRQPFQMKSALSFGLFFLLVLLLSEKISILFADAGLLATGAIAGLTDVDAITLAMSNLAGTKEVPVEIAAQTLLLAVAVNTLVKTGIVFLFGSRFLFRHIFFITILVLSFGGSIFFLI